MNEYECKTSPWPWRIPTYSYLRFILKGHFVHYCLQQKLKTFIGDDELSLQKTDTIVLSRLNYMETDTNARTEGWWKKGCRCVQHWEKQWTNGKFLAHRSINNTKGTRECDGDNFILLTLCRLPPSTQSLHNLEASYCSECSHLSTRLSVKVTWPDCKSLPPNKPNPFRVWEWLVGSSIQPPNPLQQWLQPGLSNPKFAPLSNEILIRVLSLCLQLPFLFTT